MIYDEPCTWKLYFYLYKNIYVFLLYFANFLLLLISDLLTRISLRRRRMTHWTLNCKLLIQCQILTLWKTSKPYVLEDLNVQFIPLLLLFIFYFVFFNLIRLVECMDCGRRMHQICVLHNETIWPSGWVATSISIYFNSRLQNTLWNSTFFPLLTALYVMAV